MEFVFQSRRFRTMLAIDQQRILFVGQEDTPRVEIVRQLLAARRDADRRRLESHRKPLGFDPSNGQFSPASRAAERMWPESAAAGSRAMRPRPYPTEVRK